MLKIKTTLTALFSTAVLFMLIAVAAPLAKVHAQSNVLPHTFAVADCSKDNAPASCKCDTQGELNAGNCEIIGIFQTAINVLSALVGVAIVSMIVYGGIQYSAAGDDPQKISQARQKIINAIIALVMYLFMFAFLQWLVPGGIF